jgi:5-methylcytosine-specific restriction endonuclease McrA
MVCRPRPALRPLIFAAEPIGSEAPGSYTVSTSADMSASCRFVPVCGNEYVRHHPGASVACRLRDYAALGELGRNAMKRKRVYTPEQKKARGEVAAARYAALTPEQREILSASRAAWRAARTPEQKEAERARDSARAADITPEQKAAKAAKRHRRYAALGFFERRARLRRSIPAVALCAIWERQGGKCALTGRPLRQDWSSELDHIVPLAEGGLDGATNRQWVCSAANRLKANLSDPEFVRFCIEVATHCRDDLLTPLSYAGASAVWMSSITAAA